MALALEAFHFLRPWCLVLLPLIALLWWRIRAARGRSDTPGTGIAPHLRAALIVGGDGARWLQPVDSVALILVLAVLGASGPTWSRQVDPFAAQAAPVVVVLKVTPSMLGDDIAPTRLERAKQKIRDLLDLRAGARTALVAYAGSAHVVLPMTEDPAVMRPYLEGLSPEVMPVEGDRAGDALALATDLLGAEDSPGGILLVGDGIDPADVAAAPDTLVVLSMLPEGTRDRGFDALGAPVVAVTPDAGDVRRIDGLLNTAFHRAMLDDSEQPWLDRGPWLAWPMALLLALWFRRGWTMRWAAVAGLLLMLPTPSQAGVIDWFLTPDQQGRRAYEAADFERAATLFTDPLWRGYALYRDGQYAEAVQVLDRVETAQAASIQGMAHLKSRGYRDGVRAFETALERDPDYPGAAENLATAREIVEYIERVREQSDTGEERGQGADDVVFDNEAGRGADTQIQAEDEDQIGDGLMSADQWMTTVDTRTSDFLRQRFALENAQAGDAPADSAAGDNE
ncbi:MAG: VWA domain-containing protein [Marinibacterium sp.]|nr:VWA domain-containing protein [Marinibacterium sp.]